MTLSATDPNVKQNKEDSARLVVEGTMSGVNGLKIEEDLLSRLNAFTGNEVVLDLTKVNYIDSRGISVCVSICRECRAAKRKFSVVANPVIYRLFTMINLNKVMDLTVG